MHLEQADIVNKYVCIKINISEKQNYRQLLIQGLFSFVHFYFNFFFFRQSMTLNGNCIAIVSNILLFNRNNIMSFYFSSIKKINTNK